jgi:hypothetical protein
MVHLAFISFVAEGNNLDEHRELFDNSVKV